MTETRPEAPVEQPKDLGYDAECDYCDWRLSDDPDEPGPFTKQDAERSARWHKQDCEPEVKILNPEDLASEQASRAGMKAKYPQMFEGGDAE